MKSRFVLSSFAAVAALALVGITTGTAQAVVFHQTVELRVPAGLTPDDLHVTFTGTGGSIQDEAVVPAQGAGGSIDHIPGNRVNVVWENNLAAGTLVTLTFTTAFPNIGFAGGTWTKGGASLGPVSSHPDSLEITQGTQAPGASPLVMLLIAIAVAAGGAAMLRRRIEA